MTAASDMAHCREAIRTGSHSFHAASRLLPASVRDPALALYAFCRLADDAVDEVADKGPAVLALRDRLDLAFAGRPANSPADRAFARVIETYDMPRALPEALLEGLAWDAQGRTYASLSDLRAYSARVASAVGAMMCVLMRVRDADALARACDLGVAMQLTNIARDVGEDARAGRLYLPTDWLDDVHIMPEAFLSDPHPSPQIRRMVQQLLEEARRLYHRAEAGVRALPLAARPGIFAARHVYDGIGTEIRRAGYDSITRRAHTTKTQKLGWLGRSLVQSAAVSLVPRSPVLHARPLAEVAFLVSAAADPRPAREGWSDELLGVFSQLAAQDAATGRRRSAS
ncbi:phytoene synthase [Jannaschia pagri]|uniref:Phytoene synthase n=1 Tax=Jannaschia pagri TaxID=2829797 RepID=A0ABQ4NLA6_9RHOB|nr:MULTISPECIES: phytoene/squalene synthase family protein [unclassified Jannaschia]GIT91363.1 phytoene synthase [Jannaschia sp. AI_61]GIT95197.1 phytoene synthase [Jannaschia sp. AI_62]